MSAYDFTNFERRGNIENDIQLNGAEEIRRHIVELADQSIRSIQIFTPDLEHNIYNHQDVRSSLLKFARDNRNAEIQILVDDMSNALNEGHLLIPLSQQLSSSFTIKNTPPDYHGMNIAFIVFDKTRFIFKPDRSNQYAISSTCNNRANKLLEFFSPAWEQAEVNNHTRRLSI